MGIGAHNVAALAVIDAIEGKLREIEVIARKAIENPDLDGLEIVPQLQVIVGDTHHDWHKEGALPLLLTTYPLYPLTRRGVELRAAAAKK